MSDGTILYFCELCGGSVEPGDAPERITMDSATFACETCFPLLATGLPMATLHRLADCLWNMMAEEAEVEDAEIGL